MATEFCTVALNVCGFLVCDWLHGTRMVPRTFVHHCQGSLKLNDRPLQYVGHYFPLMDFSHFGTNLKISSLLQSVFCIRKFSQITVSSFALSCNLWPYIRFFYGSQTKRLSKDDNRQKHNALRHKVCCWRLIGNFCIVYPTGQSLGRYKLINCHWVYTRW